MGIKSLLVVPVTWCNTNAYNEDDLAGESWYTENVCLLRDCANNACVCNEYLLYRPFLVQVLIPFRFF